MGVYKNTKEQNRSSNDSHGLPRPRDRCKMWPVCMYVSTSGYSETKNKKESLKTHKITEMMPFRNPPLSAPPARCKGGMEGPPALQSPQLPKKNASRDERPVVKVGQIKTSRRQFNVRHLGPSPTSRHFRSSAGFGRSDRWSSCRFRSSFA